MDTIRLHITRVSAKTSNSPKIEIFGNWLSDIGFKADALVQFVPVKDGVNFILYNYNIRDYSELVRETKEQNGKLLSIRLTTHGGKQAPTLIMTGKILSHQGLKVGDALLLRYHYGFIQAKKCDPALLGFPESEHPQVFTIRSVKNALQGNAINVNAMNVNAINGGEEEILPRFRLGSWIAEAGFEKDAVVSVGFEPNTLIFTLESDGIARYPELVKRARANRMQLIQVEEDNHKGKRTPYLDVNGALLSRVGIGWGDVVVTTHQYGQIQCKKIPLEQLGFDPLLG